MTTTSRLQHTIMATVVLGVAALVAWLSFTQEPASAFLFPRLISVFFAALAVWNFIRAASGIAKVGIGISPRLLLNILPGMIVIAVYIFYAAKNVGFYASSTVAFFIIYTLYDATPFSDIKGWLRRIVTTLVFMAVMYGLFALLLKVQTPRGMFF